MENYIKVEDNADLVRDKHSGAIVNTNTTAYDRAVARSKLAQTREINNIKCEMHEIKTLLEQLVGKE